MDEILEKGFKNIIQGMLNYKDPFELVKLKSYRETLLWGYACRGLKIEDETLENKLQIWEEVKKFGFDREESIKAAKAIYYLMYEINQL